MVVKNWSVKLATSHSVTAKYDPVASVGIIIIDERPTGRLKRKPTDSNLEYRFRLEGKTCLISFRFPAGRCALELRVNGKLQ